MTYGLKAALSIIAGTVDTELKLSEHTQSQILHRWIGERYMHEIGAKTGQGNPIQYSEKDIRRAIAYLRLINLIGAGVGKDAQLMRDRVRDMASWHTSGWVIVVGGEVIHTYDTDIIWHIIDTNDTYLVVNCFVLLFTNGGFAIPDNE